MSKIFGFGERKGLMRRQSQHFSHFCILCVSQFIKQVKTVQMRGLLSIFSSSFPLVVQGNFFSDLFCYDGPQCTDLKGILALISLPFPSLVGFDSKT